MDVQHHYYLCFLFHFKIQKCSATRQQLSTKLDVLPMLKRKLPDPEVASAKHVKGSLSKSLCQHYNILYNSQIYTLLIMVIGIMT